MGTETSGLETYMYVCTHPLPPSDSCIRLCKWDKHCYMQNNCQIEIVIVEILITRDVNSGSRVVIAKGSPRIDKVC